VPIATYFSHSYRLEDQRLNKTFWAHFKSDFSFFVDPPSDITIHTHLERMMRRCSAFVAVFNRRRDVPKLHCSPFMLYEYGLAIQARIPKLLLIDNTINKRPFEKLAFYETVYFSAGDPNARTGELLEKIERLKARAMARPDALHEPRGEIAVLVPLDESTCAYANHNARQRIEEVADLHGFGIKYVTVPYGHNGDFALELDQCEAAILDVRGTDLPDWVFPYAHGRLVPTIKLVRLAPNEVLGAIAMPPIVEGLRMDQNEPAVESVLYWRNLDDLALQLDHAFEKMDEGEIVFKNDTEGLLYFDSIGRRPAKIFISNAANENPLAQRLSRELRIRNIKTFHYKDWDAIPAGSKWPERLSSEVDACNVFLALIGPGYEGSFWSRKEMRIAAARDSELVFLPYAVEGTKLKFLDEHDLGNRQAPTLPQSEDMAVDLVLGDIQKNLTDRGRGHNLRVPRTTILGGSREAVIDTIRHVPRSSWTDFLTQLANDGIVVRPTKESDGAPRSRASAEQLFEDAGNADTDPDNKNTIVTLVSALAKAAPASHLKLITDVERRLARGADIVAT